MREIGGGVDLGMGNGFYIYFFLFRHWLSVTFLALEMSEESLRCSPFFPRYLFIMLWQSDVLIFSKTSKYFARNKYKKRERRIQQTQSDWNFITTFHHKTENVRNAEKSTRWMLMVTKIMAIVSVYMYKRKNG